MTNKRRRLTGVVIGTKMAKTATVRVNRSYRHPLYGKVVRTSKNYLAHDEIGCRLGDRVKLVESKPLSRRKRWAVEAILDRASESDIAASGVVEASPMAEAGA